MTEGAGPGEGGLATPVAQDTPGTELNPAQLMALAALAGNINVDITLPNGTVYKLAVAVPTGGGDPYTFQLTETPSGGTDQTLADFVLKDQNNFSVQVSIPTIDAGGTKISGGFLLKMGTPEG